MVDFIAEYVPKGIHREFIPPKPKKASQTPPAKESRTASIRSCHHTDSDSGCKVGVCSGIRASSMLSITTTAKAFRTTRQWQTTPSTTIGAGPLCPAAIPIRARHPSGSCSRAARAVPVKTVSVVPLDSGDPGPPS
ncbi:hypothetical protein PAPYR_12506 [Paratrimastix pyriformis]|uniref:Uncharacterized protein n=1 Tax=Paratrimastix pyriformis TaxID=342808 RepID=A0ABQ8U710_9EUKA|nr:hypothetical protein PAPYR_12506 [Paratrimastix pyriformis]